MNLKLNSDSIGRISLSNSRLRTLDFLRGVAILGVIVVHTTQGFPSQLSIFNVLAGFGRFGVQLFYFISALTMCYMWALHFGEEAPVKKFYLRRFFRIAPLFWIAIPIYLLVNGLSQNYWAPEGIGILQIFLTATFLHGFWPNSINSVVPGGWSIAVEVTFYVFFPLLIIKIKDKRIVYLLIAFAIWIFNIFIFKKFATSFFSIYYITNSTTIINEFLYLNFINQAPIFLVGCYLYFALRQKPKVLEIIILIVWILFAAVLRFFYKVEGFSFLSTCATLGIFVYLCMNLNLRFKLLENLGRNSYAIYLIQFMVIYALEKIFPDKTLNFISWLFMIALVTLISYFLSIISYIFIEKKVQQFVVDITKPKYT